MAWFAARQVEIPVARPVLHLSGPRLADYLGSLLAAAEHDGGVERYVRAVALKSELFRELLGGGRAARLVEDEFNDLCVFIAPARRRVGRWLAGNGFLAMQAALAALFAGAEDTSTTDARLTTFQERFPRDGAHRWARDLAAEVLHYADPERYPLMARWMWDGRVNAGVLREIWWGEDVDRERIAVADDYATFLGLREELAQFLSDNGVFRDVPFYIDLLCAHIYGAYVAAHGASYLRTDFSAPEDPMLYTRRMLGLDGIASPNGRTRLKRIDGSAWVLDDQRLLT